MRTLSLVVLTQVLQAVAVHAQEARLIASDRPTIELPYEFTSIDRVFELRDQRVVVLDRLEADVRLADMRTGTTNVLGRIGDGPGEYRAPLTLIPLGGDSVGVFDDANVRILVINGTGSVGGFVSPYSMAEGTRIGGTVGDGRGWLYAEQRATSASDSVTIFRWRIGSQAADRVVRMHRPLVRGA